MDKQKEVTVGNITLESYNKLIDLGYKVNMPKYVVWSMYESSAHSPNYAVAMKFVVVNRVNHQIQSSWFRFSDAEETRDALNGVKK